MRSKSFHVFEQKLIYFEDDLELIDVILINVIKGELTDSKSQNILKNIDDTKHLHIARRKNSDTGRLQIVNHLRATLYSSYVKDVYEELTHYLRSILEQSAENGFDAGRVIGEHAVKMDGRAVLEAGNWNNVAKMVADSVFQLLETEKSTLKLIEKISTKLALNIDPKLIDDAVPYLEVRHCLVHTDGKVNDAFKKKYPKIILKKSKVVLDENFITNLKKTVKALVVEFDKKVIAGNLIQEKDTQP